MHSQDRQLPRLRSGVLPLNHRGYSKFRWTEPSNGHLVGTAANYKRSERLTASPRNITIDT